MSGLMLHGVLNMPLPDDPTECDPVTWVQFKDRARQASQRIKELEAKLAQHQRIPEIPTSHAVWADRALQAEAKLAKAVEAVENAERLISGELVGVQWVIACNDFLRDARATLAELKGGQE